IHLEDLGPEEGADEHQEGDRQHPPGPDGALPQAGRVELVHASSRMSSQRWKVTRTSAAISAVVTAWSGACTRSGTVSPPGLGPLARIWIAFRIQTPSAITSPLTKRLSGKKTARPQAA